MGQPEVVALKYCLRLAFPFTVKQYGNEELASTTSNLQSWWPQKETKKTHESIKNRLALVMKSGKYTLGYKTVLRNSKEAVGTG
ncbi:60S ribosomal protein L30-like [Cucumis melo var. makuwa]|uniref:60S ribosomal protein L30-like n=1 Tax=Cucumis melo var. makuwa TaxID=1194695 RepID=A0A5D3DXM7_CUCMM|nr:60S ribosomal protein L30-like [Cucumis melo var. makuwa]